MITKNPYKVGLIGCTKPGVVRKFKADDVYKFADAERANFCTNHCPHPTYPKACAANPCWEYSQRFGRRAI